MIRIARYSLIFVLTFCVTALAGDQAKFKITYVSADNYYVDCGTDDGVHVGDQLLAKNDTGISYILEVIYAAQHSSSCRKVGGEVTPVVNDVLLLVITAPDSTADTAAAVELSPIVESNAMTRPVSYSEPTTPTRVTGNVSLILHNWSDNNSSELSYAQSTLRLDLGADRIAGRNLSFKLRSRGRHDNRLSSYYDSQWENRLWQFSFTYTDENERILLSAGRFIPRQFSRVGYIDGLLIEGRLSQKFRIAAYGGQQPKWAFQDIEQPVNRYGGYMKYAADRHSDLYYDQTFGFVGEYINGSASRTFLAISGNLRYGARWTLSHAVELDFNTGWREARAGRKLQLTSAYVRSTYRIVKPIRVGLKYDNRQNYWTYFNRSMADSLFDDRVRRGLDGDLTITPGRGYSFRGSVGHRKSTGDSDPIVSYTASASKGRIFGRNILIGLYFSGFDGPFEMGRNTTIRTSFDAGSIGRLSIAYGRYSYKVKDFGNDRLSQMFETEWRRTIMTNTYLSGTVQHNSGDDIDGWRLIFESGYRF